MANSIVSVTLTSGQRIVPLPFSYMPGTGSLFVSINGKMLSSGEYTELSVDSVYLLDPADAGDVLEARNLES